MKKEKNIWDRFFVEPLNFLNKEIIFYFKEDDFLFRKMSLVYFIIGIMLLLPGLILSNVNLEALASAFIGQSLLLMIFSRISE